MKKEIKNKFLLGILVGIIIVIFLAGFSFLLGYYNSHSKQPEICQESYMPFGNAVRDSGRITKDGQHIFISDSVIAKVKCR